MKSSVAAIAIVSVAAALFAVFPLTDTDIWWHLACAREWVTTWTPVRTPVVNVHVIFQQVVAFVYNMGGAPLLVAAKSVLWGLVFLQFLGAANAKEKCKSDGSSFFSWIAVVLLFVFRYQFEIRPVVFSLLFLGVYWNALPIIFEAKELAWWKKLLLALLILVIQWLWCKCQGLFILGPIFALVVLVNSLDRRCVGQKKLILYGFFVALLFGMPFLHKEGLLLAIYPFELLNRLVGLSPSGTIFAKEIAENRSPLSLLMSGENMLTSVGMLLVILTSFAYSTACLVRNFIRKNFASRQLILPEVLLALAVLALTAERNFVLLMPVFLIALRDGCNMLCTGKHLQLGAKVIAVLVLAFVVGLWCRSLLAYDKTMISFQRVPVAAAEWMKNHPHGGRLFNDDRAGGYLAFVNPQDPTFIDGRFILKTADFFERYLNYASAPESFLQDASLMNVDRAVFPLRYYARWQRLLRTLVATPGWHLSYKDSYFAVFDCDN